MDVYSFVNSKDIREYLRTVQYSFQPLEAAWLIYACRTLNFEARKKYWTELIETMSDCNIPKRGNRQGFESLHAFLKNYISIMDRRLQDFLKQQPSGSFVYSYSYLYRGDQTWTEEFQTIFPVLTDCLKAFEQDRLDLEHDDAEAGRTGVIKYRIRKQNLFMSSELEEFEFDGAGKFTEIIGSTIGTEEENEILQAFAGWWFDFPTPFKKGDIVWESNGDLLGNEADKEPFVLAALSSWEPGEFIKNNGDMSDMNGCGYFLREDGTVYYEVMSNYMDLEYYHGPYKGNESILPVLGNFLQGTIDIGLFMCLYRKVLLEAADMKQYERMYPKELVEQAYQEPLQLEKGEL